MQKVRVASWRDSNEDSEPIAASPLPGGSQSALNDRNWGAKLTWERSARRKVRSSQEWGGHEMAVFWGSRKVVPLT